LIDSKEGSVFSLSSFGGEGRGEEALYIPLPRVFLISHGLFKLGVFFFGSLQL
jgi:hypothetical protein